jgi:hypothetical protein
LLCWESHLYCYAESCYVKWCYAVCRYDKRHMPSVVMLSVVCWVSYAKCRMLSVVCWVSYAECRMLSVVMMSVACWVSYAECHMLSVVKLSVIYMLSVSCWVSYAKCRMLSVCIQSLTLVPILAYKRNKYTFYNCVYKDESFLSIRKMFFYYCWPSAYCILCTHLNTP